MKLTPYTRKPRKLERRNYSATDAHRLMILIFNLLVHINIKIKDKVSIITLFHKVRTLDIHVYLHIYYNIFI